MPITLVTGGAGFIGRHVVQELLSLEHQVIVLDDLSGGFKENVPAEAELIVGSILDQQLLSELFEKYAIEYIFHLAAYAAEGLSHFIKNYNYQNNVVGSVNLINEAVRNDVRCFVFTSSIAVYGEQKPPMTEDMIPAPKDSYGIAKYAVEQELKISKEMFDLDYIIFRPHNVYGEYQNIADPYRNVIGIFMNQLMNRKSLSIFGDGSQTRAFSYIGDIAPVIARSINLSNAYGEVFNIGSDQHISVNELAKQVMLSMKISSDINFLEERNEVLHAYAIHKKVHQFFELPRETPLREGLEKMAHWVRQTSSRPIRKFETIEITKNLPPFWK